MPSNRTPTRIYGPAEPASGASTIYTVAAGKIVVIRTVVYVWAGANELGLTVNGTGVEDQVFYRQETISEFDMRESWQYIVLEAGDVLSAFADGTGVGLTINADVYDA